MRCQPEMLAGARLRWLAPLLIVAAVAITFCPLFGAQFLDWDDQETLSGNARFNPPTLAGVAYYWAHSHLSLYIPVTYTYWGAIATIAHAPDSRPALRPEFFHAANIMLHAAAALMVFGILRRLVKAPLPALFGAALFALHPVQVEPVAWVSGAKDVLSALLGLIAIDRYIAAVAQDDPPRPRPRRRSSLNYGVATGAFVLAMLAKPSAVILPLVVAAIDSIMLRRSRRQVALTAAPWLALAAPIAMIGKLVQPAMSIDAPPVWARPLIAGDALNFYVKTLVAPLRSIVDYGRAPDRVMQSTFALAASWLAPVGIVAAVFFTARRAPAVAAGLLIAVASVLPVLGFIPFEFQQYSTVADHYLYPAMFGIALVVAGIAKAIAEYGTTPRRVLGWTMVLLLLAMGAKSFSYARVWKNSNTLFEYVLQVDPGNRAANQVLGYLAAQRGQTAAAIQLYENALARAPNDPLTHFNYANLLLRENRPAEALSHYRAAIAQRPDRNEYRNNCGVALALTGDPAGAKAEWNLIVQRDPDHADAHLNLANALAREGDTRGARFHYQEVLRIRPNSESARQRLNALNASSK